MMIPSGFLQSASQSFQKNSISPTFQSNTSLRSKSLSPMDSFNKSIKFGINPTINYPSLSEDEQRLLRQYLPSNIQTQVDHYMRNLDQLMSDWDEKNTQKTNAVKEKLDFSHSRFSENSAIQNTLQEKITSSSHKATQFHESIQSVENQIWELFSTHLPPLEDLDLPKNLLNKLLHPKPPTLIPIPNEINSLLSNLFRNNRNNN